jgi:hypothetical protein
MVRVGVVAGVVSLVLAGVPGTASARSEENRSGADLSVRLVVSPALAQPGKPLIYQATVSNEGPEDAVLPVLIVRLPEEVAILGVNVAECLPGSTANEVVCASQQDVLAGGAGGVTISGIVRPGARGPLRATATLSSAVVDENTANDSAQTLTSVGEGTDLAVKLSREERHGRLVTVGAVIRNRGPHTVRDAAILLDTGKAHFLSADGARCRSHLGSVGCELRAVGAGSRVSLRLAFRARGHSPQAQATVFSVRLGDRRPANNVASINLGRRPASSVAGPNLGRRPASSVAGPNLGRRPASSVAGPNLGRRPANSVDGPSLGRSESGRKSPNDHDLTRNVVRG